VSARLARPGATPDRGATSQIEADQAENVRPREAGSVANPSARKRSIVAEISALAGASTPFTESAEEPRFDSRSNAACAAAKGQQLLRTPEATAIRRPIGFQQVALFGHGLFALSPMTWKVHDFGNSCMSIPGFCTRLSLMTQEQNRHTRVPKIVTLHVIGESSNSPCQKSGPLVEPNGSPDRSSFRRSQ